MKNNLFIFGDSFSNSYFGKFNLYEKLDYEINHWFEILAAEFDLNLINEARSGSSNQEIVDTFLLNFNKMKPNDIVIIGGSVLSRIVGYNSIKKKVTTINNDYFLLNERNKTISQLLEENREYQDAQIKVIDFMYDNIINHLDEWNYYFEEKFKILVNICLKQNIKCFFWTYKCWNDFSSYSDEGLANDGHWGVEGNKYFAEYLIHRIKNNDYYMNISSKEFGNKKMYG